MGELADGSGSLIGTKVFLSTLASILAWRLRLLTGPGATIMGLMGLTILLVAGWLWLIPVLAFFLTASLLGHLPNAERDEPEMRTAWQVLANGAAAWGAVVLLLRENGATWHTTDSLVIYVGAVAAANADTWATELGLRLGGPPRDIVSGRTLAPGASGGITGVGTVSAALGALFIASLLPWVDTVYSGNWAVIGYIALAGWLGAMADSLLGSIAQLRYRCRVCGEETEKSEHCGTAASPRRGFLTNNQVNWVCTAIGGLSSWAWLRW